MKFLIAPLAAIGMAFVCGGASAAGAPAPDAAGPYAQDPYAAAPDGTTPYAAPPDVDRSAAPTDARSGAYATVVSSTPVVVQVVVPRERCMDQPGYVQAPPSGAGAVVGGILGGLAGNAIGAGAGRALATGVGAIAGLVVGNNVEAATTPPVPVTTTNCVYSRSLERRIVGYDVVYELDGRRYTTRTARDPGSRIALVPQAAGAMPDDESSAGVAAAADAPPYQATPYPPGAYPAPPPYPYPYPPVAYGAGYYPYPAVPIVIGARFGGWHGYRWR